MAQTTAERQRSFRQRQVKVIAELQASVAELEHRLAVALADVERLSSVQCRHPAEAVDGGSCRACGQDIW